jgi:hypothetical protein
MIRKVWDLISAAAAPAIVYKLARGPRQPMTDYERGYIAGSFKAMRIQGEAIRDARARGLIR